MPRKIRSAKTDLSLLVVRYNEENRQRLQKYSRGVVTKTARSNRRLTSYKRV